MERPNNAAERRAERRRGKVTVEFARGVRPRLSLQQMVGRKQRKNMKTKQLEEIKSLRSRLSNLGTGNAPSLERHVMIALCSGEVPKLKPAVAISDTARNQIINERYSGRSLKFSDVFASTNGYEGEMSQWKAHEAKRKTALARFEKDAEKIMVKAMDSESDAEAIVEQLHDAAERSGLKALKAPVFGQAE